MRNISVKAAFKGARNEKYFCKILQIACISILALLAMVIPGCTPAHEPEFGFDPILSISEPPALGKPVKVRLSFTPQSQFTTYTLRINMTPGVYEVIDGTLEANGITANNPSMEITIKSIRTTGSGEIIGQVKADTPHETPWELDELFITITDKGATVSHTMPPAPPGIPTITVPSGSYTTN